MKNFFLFFVVSISSLFSADIVVFSYNRPLQLYAFLESVEMHVKHVDKVFVIYRASDPIYESSYNEVFQRFAFSTPIKQNHHLAKRQFKSTLLSVLFDKALSNSRYIVFAVDDIVITDPIDFQSDERLLEKHKAYGFFYRLGKNITECYMTSSYSGLPNNLQEIESNILTWNFFRAKGDWNYPNNLDFTLYRKEDIKQNLIRIPFTFPNDFESNWDRIANRKKIGLCPIKSKMVNLPLNIISGYNTKATGNFSAHDLHKIFLDGMKMDILPIQQILNKSPHMDYDPTFILR